MAEKHLIKPVETDKMPGGIPYIIGNEAAERFSFYGMKAILVIFMTQYLHNRSGDLDVMSSAEANVIYHNFITSAYFFPIIGSIISDVFLGKYKTIISLSIVYCLGHIVLALDETRLGLSLGLTLIAIGAGGIKPCVSAHVGDQFGKANHHMLPRVFSWFYFSINLGSVLSTLMIPWILDTTGQPSLAFGLPGALMILATIVFWMGRNKFVHIPPHGKQAVQEIVSKQGLLTLLNLFPLVLCVAMFWGLFDQTGSSWVTQARYLDTEVLGFEILPSQVQAANPFLILVFIPLFSYILYPAINKFFPLTPLRKIGIGLFVMAGAFALVAWVDSSIPGGRLVPFKHQVTNKATDDSEEDTYDVVWKQPSLTKVKKFKHTFKAENLLDSDPGEKPSGWVSDIYPRAPYNSKRPPEPSLVAVVTEMFSAPEEEKKGGDGADNLLPLSAENPEEIAIRLAENKAWKINKVAISADMDLTEYLAKATEEARKKAEEAIAKAEEKGESTEDLTKPEDINLGTSNDAKAKEIEILVSNKRTEGWKSVGKFELGPMGNRTEFTFDAVETKFVLVRVISNFGGNLVSLSEIEVFSEGENGRNVAAIGSSPSVLWQVLAFIILTAAEIMVSITGLEFFYTQSPKKMKSFVMSIWLLSVAIGNYFTSWVNHFIQNKDGTEWLEGTDYFMFFTYIMLGTSVVFVILSQFYKGRTYVQGDEDQAEIHAEAETDMH